MAFLLVAGLLAVLDLPTTPGTHTLKADVPEVGEVRYAVSIPSNYEAGRPRPLVLALHPGGERIPYYGSVFARQVVAAGLRDLQPIILAPDCPTRSWTDPQADRAVMTLMQNALEAYSIDRTKILVVGFSLGGRGTWFMSSHHSDLFTAAIPMAASTGDEPVERLATIHSRDDEVVPFGPAERNARALETLGRSVRFEALSGVGHYQMGGYIDALKRAGRWVAERWGK